MVGGLGLRMTPQRQLLLQTLSRMSHHPTADQVYRRLKRVLPSVSPATVYRNVRTLAEVGVLSTLERAGESVHYDLNLDEHHHFVCSRCRRVFDIYLSDLAYQIDPRRSGLKRARIDTAKVQLHGRCARCRRSA
jgi:Fur family peroxide stress response transcriptional regulator